MAYKIHNGVEYYFVVYKHDQEKWVLNRKKFLLNDYRHNGKDKLMGQYICDLWYNSPQDKEKGLKFAVVGVSHGGQLKPTIDLLNSNSSLWGSTCNFIEIFECDRHTTKKLVRCTKDEECHKYEFVGNINRKNLLYMRFDYVDEMLLGCLPEFIRIL